MNLRTVGDINALCAYMLKMLHHYVGCIVILGHSCVQLFVCPSYSHVMPVTERTNFRVSSRCYSPFHVFDPVLVLCEIM
jgi:hypothetical protein